MSPDDNVARETPWRLRVGAVAVLAGLLPLAAFLLQASQKGPFPNNSPETLFYFHRNAGTVLEVGILGALGSLAVIVPLFALATFARARRTTLPPVPRIMAILGGVGGFVATLLLNVAQVLKADDYVAHSQGTYAEAHDVLTSPVLAVGQYLGLAAALALGFAYVMTSLYAMRVGLLTRFMGYIGIFAGVLSVIAAGGQASLIQAFWLLALAALFLGRWPSGMPPAWGSGRDEPWPTMQELRERRESGVATAGGGGRTAGTAAAPPAVPAPGREPGAVRRKRKKRK